MVWIRVGWKSRQEVRGTVADLCLFCQKVQQFVVSDYYQAFHLQGFKIEDWKFSETGKKCQHCGNEIVCEKKNFSEIVPEEDAECPLEELLERTNRQLVAQFRKVAYEELGYTEARVNKGRQEPIADPEWEQLQARMSGFDPRDPETIKLKEQLKIWGKLDTNRRNKISLVINSISADQQELRQAMSFLAQVASTRSARPSFIGCLLVFFFTAVAIVTPIFVSRENSWLHMTCAGFFALTVLSVIWMLFVHIRAGRWLRTVVVPRAKMAKIPLHALLKATQTVEGWPADEGSRVVGVDMGQLALLIQREMHSSTTTP